jgi:parvulin-like peptidyl-prolyl isomerase
MLGFSVRRLSMDMAFLPWRNSDLTTYRGWLCLLLLAAVAWGQAAKPAARPAPPKAATASAAAATNTAGGAANIGPATAVITIAGLCDKPPVNKSKAPDCKTVVTRAEFEQLVAAVAPTIAAPARKQLATQYGMALVMVHKAHEMGLDQGPRFQQLMRVARIGVLTKELSRKLQEQAEKLSDKEIEAYYHNHEASFQEVDLQRIFIPRSKQSAESKDKPSDDAAAKDAAKKEQQESEEAMKKLAEALRGRAAAGEDFAKLQDEAIASSGFKGKPPTRLGKVRRTSLPPDQGEVFNLKVGETSQLITTPNGYLVYKVGDKDTLPLDQVREEISTALQSQRMQDAMQAIQQSATPELNPKYFADATADAPHGQTPDAAQPATKAPEPGPK